MATPTPLQGTLPGLLASRADPRVFQPSSKTSASFLDVHNQNCTELCRKSNSERMIWDPRLKRSIPLASYNILRRQRRSFHRCCSGLRMGGQYRFLTLTQSPAASAAGLNIRSSFRALVMRMRRRGLLSGYIRVVEYTKAGEPHLHVLFRGTYVSQMLLSSWWLKIHLSSVVDIRRVSGTRGAARELGKYLGKDPRSRYSWSWDWVWRGFVKDWKDLCRDGLSRGYSLATVLDVWVAILDRYRPGVHILGHPLLGVCYG